MISTKTLYLLNMPHFEMDEMRQKGHWCFKCLLLECQEKKTIYRPQRAPGLPVCNLCSLLLPSVYPTLKWVSEQDPSLRRAVEGLNEMKPLEGLSYPWAHSERQLVFVKTLFTGEMGRGLLSSAQGNWEVLSQNLGSCHQSANLSACCMPRVMGMCQFKTLWGGWWEGASGWGTRVHPWQIHADVWQNQYNIVK